MKVIEEYAINKMICKTEDTRKLWSKGEIKQDLLKYIPIKKQAKERINFEKYINVVLFNKFD